MTSRSSRREVRNPVLALPAAREIMALPLAQRMALKRLLRDLKGQCRDQEREAYSKRKGPMTAYWIAAGTYSGHIANALTSGDQPMPFQARVAPWMQECFGPTISADALERNDRFIEEALELVQSLGYTADRAHALVDYVFGRPVGDPPQEVGGVMVTLAALCLAASLDMHAAGEVELARINQPAIIEKIRAKQATKPTGSALPIDMSGEANG